MSSWNLAIAAGYLIVSVMWIIELRDIFSESKQDDGPMGERSCAKSDVSGAFRPRARAMGGFAGSQAQNAAGKPLRNRPRIGENDWREVGSVKDEAKSLHKNGEGVKK